MYSKITVAGHPIHPMLIAYPVAGYTGTFVGFMIYGANGEQFWLNFALVMNYVGVFGALLAALPGFVDWAFGIPSDSEAKRVGMAHAGFNVAALVLFAINLGVYASHWNGPPRSATLGIVLGAIGVASTITAGYLGWMLVQTFHVGVGLTPRQTDDEPQVQATRPSLRIHHGHAS